MSRTSYVILGLLLLTLAFLSMNLASAADSCKRIEGQDGKSSRYQMVSWSYAYPGYQNQPGGGGPQGRYGAYILDMESGEVHLIEENKKPIPIGSIKK